MTVTYKKGMLATIGKPGMKIAQYRVTGAGSEDGLTINAKDIGLSTIMSLDIQEGQVDAAPTTKFVVGIGTFTPGKGAGNYATVRACTTCAGTDTTLCGTMQVMAIGI